MSTARVEFHTPAISAFLVSSDLNDGLTHWAEVGRARMVAAAPKRTGRYAERFFVASAMAPVMVAGYPRTVVYLGNDDPAAAPIEYGNRGREGQRIMGRVAAQLSAPRQVRHG